MTRTFGIKEARPKLGDLINEMQVGGGDIVLTRNGKPAARLIPYREDPPMKTALPTLSDDTSAAVANLVNYTIEREYGRAVADDLARRKKMAIDGLMLDMRNEGADEGMLRGQSLAYATLRILVRQGLEARLCQCRVLNPNGCPHATVIGSLWCEGHFEQDVPATRGALLCGTCYCAEDPASAPDWRTDVTPAGA
jgi:prevent-host-death family protein